MRRTAALLLLTAPVFAQPSFEVASVKVNTSGETRMAVDMRGGGTFTANNVPMKVMIMMAYKARPESVTGGPAWLEADRFDIVAKAPQTASPDELRRMLQTLLAERFKLAVHNESKLSTAYALVAGKSTPKMQPSEDAPLSEQRCVPGEGEPGQKHLVCRHMPMAVLAQQLQESAPRDIDAPVVDQTGLKGGFDFKLDWSPDPSSGPSIFQALETQLGLKLESRKLPLPVIVIDRVERVPVEN